MVTKHSCEKVMGKALIIAEKPSVASDIAKALGGFQKQDDHLESDRFVISSAVGHLLTISAPEEFEVKRGKWTFAHLPVIPTYFDLRPIEKSVERLRLLTKLIKRADIDLLINACDAGREGELIFRYIIQHAKSKKPIQRLWLQSMTPASIRDGFTHLRDDASMQPLADAATCRSESDWLVGINGTRAMTAFNSKSGGFQLTTVGRVQTPTLAILVEREERIKRFVSRDYWEIHGTFEAKAGDYSGRWFDETFARDKTSKEPDDQLKAERVWTQAQADAIQAKCQGRPGIVTEESKPTTQLSPLLFDLTSLQREGNSRFGYPARRTLQIAQALYEKHKVLTYPRTDSRALPEDYIETVKKVMETLGETQFAPFAGHILEQGWVRPNKRIFNNSKISDHFAITPTQIAPKNLDTDEAKIYDLVTRRFLAVFYPAAEFLVTTRITRVENEPFKSEGKVMMAAGWLAIYGREAQQDDTPMLTRVEANERVATREVEVVPLHTKPPARFTEATLLGAMEGAGKLIEDEELRDAMSAKGLGTPATRAAIIEGLIYEQNVQRVMRDLQATAKGISLITLLRGLSIPELCSPELTGNWEFKLKQMERGELGRTEFMQQIAEMTQAIVAKTKQYESDTVPGDYSLLGTPCPKCSAQIKETYKKYQCTSCDFSLWKIVASRQIDVKEVEELLREKKVGPLQGFKSKMGRPFAALIKLTPEGKAEFDFGQPNGEADVEVDFTHQEALGPCPKCEGQVFENGMHYTCQNATGPAKKCDFRTGKIILQREIERGQITKLLTARKTDLLQKFISKKGRPFSAFLVVGEGGKVGFEFAPRAAAPTTSVGKRRGGIKKPAVSKVKSASEKTPSPPPATGEDIPY